jgi:hypothetical protein
MPEAPSPPQLLSQMLTGYWASQAIHVAAELGVADLLADGPRTVEELAERSSAHPPSLYRLMRALASIGVFSEEPGRRFALTPVAACLQDNGLTSQRSFARIVGREFYQSWGNLFTTVRTGERGFDMTYGAPWVEYFTAHPERGRLFDAAMTGIHGAESEPMLDAYDLSVFGTVADIGGGNGTLLAAVLNRHPGVRGILFDLPEVVDGARPTLAALGLEDRCELVAGSFFGSVPAGADAYMMRHVLHDWEDEDAISILRNCREAMSPTSKVLVVESVIPPPNEPSFGKWLDLMMLVVGGRERTEEEYRRLFSSAGLELTRVVPTDHEVSIVEGVRGD